MADTIKILDCSSGRTLLNGKGEPLPPGEPPVWLEFTTYDGNMRNSAGELFDPQPTCHSERLSDEAFLESKKQVHLEIARAYRIPPHLLGEAIPQPAFIKPLTDTELAQWEAQHICARAAKIIAERDPVEETDALHFTRLVVEADTPVTVEAKHG